MGKKAAGRYVLCTHRRVTPALGARLLRSYVPLRYGPSESGCDNNTCLPADTLLVRKIRISPYVIFLPPGIFRITHTHANDTSAITTISPGTAIHADRSHGSIYFL